MSSSSVTLSERKSSLAKLLANENVEVVHGNFQTAWFDTQNRKIGIPHWKNIDNDLYDLFVGHEVGHALFTPNIGAHDCKESIKGIPRSYLNIVEDIRIERKIQKKYPGLSIPFKKAYMNLFNQEFFGIKELADVADKQFMDRLNLKMKMRDLIDVPFSADEMKMFELADSVDTWEDTVAVCKALVKFVKSKKPKNEQPQTAPKFQQPPKDTPPEQDTPDEFEEEEESPSPSADELEEEESPSTSADNNADSDDDDDDGEEESPSNSYYVDGDEEEEELPEVETDTAFRKNESNIEVEEDVIVNGLTAKQMKLIVVRPEQILKEYKEVYRDERWNQSLVDGVKEFRLKNKNIILHLKKHFDLKKSAYQNSRAKTSNSGELDVKKLHSYSYNEEIFNKVTTLADAKNHGMIFLIDASASMANVLRIVIEQSLILADFCKAVGVPFEIHTFTNKPGMRDEKLFQNDDDYELNASCYNFSCVLSSDVKKQDYEILYQSLFEWGKSPTSAFTYMRSKYMGGTPTIEALSGYYHYIPEFKAKHRVDKMVFMVLTDGDPQNIRVVPPTNPINPKSGLKHNYKLRVGNKTYKSGGSNNNDTIVGIMNQIKNKVGNIQTISYNILEDKYDFTTHMYKIRQEKKWSNHGEYSDPKMSQKCRNDGFVSFKDTLGFDELFLIMKKSKLINGRDDDLKIDEDASKGVVISSFKKYSKSKKNSKIFATNLAESIA